jgi:hypothetical protein
MPSKGIVALYGDLSPEKCDLHGEMATRFGTLIDPNGHTWTICAECINTLWAERQMMNLEPTREEKVEGALKLLRAIWLGEDYE